MPKFYHLILPENNLNSGYGIFDSFDKCKLFGAIGGKNACFLKHNSYEKALEHLKSIVNVTVDTVEINKWYPFKSNLKTRMFNRKVKMLSDDHLISVVVKSEDAVLPVRQYEEDIGMDLVCIKIHKKLDNGVILYDTGLSMKPPKDHYIEILPRSSISKSGWFLANSVGIIDPNYTGNFLVALAPLNEKSVPPEPPFCLTQIILRKAIRGSVIQVESLEETERGDGGFGSTNKN